MLYLTESVRLSCEFEKVVAATQGWTLVDFGQMSREIQVWGIGAHISMHVQFAPGQNETALMCDQGLQALGPNQQ